MKKYDITLFATAFKYYKGIEAESRDEAQAIAVQMFKKNEYADITSDTVARFDKEYD